jgi:hypothetical protein
MWEEEEEKETNGKLIKKRYPKPLVVCLKRKKYFSRIRKVNK